MSLITLGCSLTAEMGVKEELAELLNQDMINLAQSAGSNQLQIFRLHECLNKKLIKSDDIIYWQLTSISRRYLRISFENILEVNQVQEKNFKFPLRHYVESQENIFDNKKRIDLFCNSPMISRKFDEEQILQELVATLILIKSYCPKTIVVFGWNRIMPLDYMLKFKNILTDNSIDYIKQTYLEYAYHNNLEMDDHNHPAPSAGIKFANEVVYPKLIELQWV